jgi:hypothetical protein
VTPWRLDAISTQDASFDSSRLVYSTPASHLKLEFLRIGQELFAYLFIQQHRLATLVTKPDHVEVTLSIDGVTNKHFLPLRKGSMRLPLPKELRDSIILALQDGKEVGILLDGFKQIISPASFQEKYEEFLGGTVDFFQFIIGPLK